VNYHISGGLGLHYCLNTTQGACDCQHWVAPFPPTCVPLVDNHDGTYSGAIDGYTVGNSKRANFRFFQQRQPSAEPGSPLEEVVIGAWGDGTECVGGAANAQFQSSGGNCFRGVVFDLECTSSHGPFAVAMESDDGRTISCTCPSGWEQLRAGGAGRWQCIPAAAASTTPAKMPSWVLPFAATCAGITALSLGFAWWVRKSVVSWATNGGAGLRSGLVDWVAEPASGSAAGME
jgi:hypothetical protein